MEREQSCESFDLLLQTLHQVLLHEHTPLSLELGIHNGEVIQAFRTGDKHSRRAIKNALRNVYPTSRLSTLPEDSFRPPVATSMYFADVNLDNDLFSINRWQQLLTQSDPLSTLLGSLVVNQHSRFYGHVAIALFPLSPKLGKIHLRAFEGLQSEFMQDHKFISKLFELSARSHLRLLRTPAWGLQKLIGNESLDDKSMNLGSARHHERETDVQSASNKLSGSCFQKDADRLLARVRTAFGISFHFSGPAKGIHSQVLRI